MDDFQVDSKPVLIFGASGEQGRSVLEAYSVAGYSPIYGFTSKREPVQDQYLTEALQCIILEGQLGNPEDVRKALLATRAQTIFLTTTTEMPVLEAAGCYKSAEEEEYRSIVNFFTTLVQVYHEDGLTRTVIFSTQENVEDLCRKHLEKTGGRDVLIETLDDGSIVPHFSGELIDSYDNSSPQFVCIIPKLFPIFSQRKRRRKGVGSFEGYSRAAPDSHHSCFLLQ